MLTIKIKGAELFDDSTCTFSYTDPVVLKLEHSLLSLTKWESKWMVPFFNSDDKTDEQIIDYIKCMTINDDIDDDVYDNLDPDDLDKINKYISSPMSATTISKNPNKPKSRDIITNELVYYWMFSAGIPKECETWHLSRLFMLLEVYNAMNSKDKKMNPKDLAARNRALNEQRKAKYKTKG